MTTSQSQQVPGQRGVTEEEMQAVASGERPVLEAITAMNLDTLLLSNLDARTYFLVRLAALVAVDGPPASYLVNLGMAAEAGVSFEDVQGVLTAVAPIVGSPRVVSAAGNALQALGFALAAGEEQAYE
jgi:alkylhydroperoxidase/carboxymuconolactone decarboxylase family protein YurZ